MLSDRMNVTIGWYDSTESWSRSMKALRGEEMTDRQFDRLKRDLQDTWNKLERLKKRYRDQTRERWVPDLKL